MLLVRVSSGSEPLSYSTDRTASHRVGDESQLGRRLSEPQMLQQVFPDATDWTRRRQDERHQPKYNDGEDDDGDVDDGDVADDGDDDDDDDDVTLTYRQSVGFDRLANQTPVLLLETWAQEDAWHYHTDLPRLWTPSQLLPISRKSSRQQEVWLSHSHQHTDSNKDVVV